MKNHDTAEKVVTPQKQRNVSHQGATKVSYTATKAKNEFGRLLEQAIVHLNRGKLLNVCELASTPEWAKAIVLRALTS